VAHTGSKFLAITCERAVDVDDDVDDDDGARRASTAVLQVLLV
jgi:hypothetical protein